MARNFSCLIRMEPDSPLRFFERRLHQLTDRLEDRLNLRIMLFDLPLELAQLMSKFFVGRKNLPKFNECSHYRYINVNGSFAIKNAG